MSHTRRKFLRDAAGGLLLFSVGGCRVPMTPQEARQTGLAYRVLSADEASTLDALGEVLLPGSAAAGLTHFVDQQLAAPAHEQLLMIKYLGVNPPFIPFYRGGLAALDAAARSAHGEAFSLLAQQQQVELVGQIAQENPDDWDGPPAPFFYFVLRGDAVDVVYGTNEGAAKLDLPYMAHIEPPQGWG